MRIHRLEGRKLRGSAARDVEAGAMSGALDLVAFELALVQRASIMRTQIVDRIELTVHVAHGDFMVTDLKNRHALGWDISCLGYRLPSGHARDHSSFNA